VVHRHGARRLAQTLWYRFLLGQLLGDVADTIDVLGAHAGIARATYRRASR
jgi:hypothetical protein